MHDITAIVYTVRQIAALAVANYNRVEVFRTSRVASMLPCSSCVYTYNYDISDSGRLTFFKETLSSFSGTA